VVEDFSIFDMTETDDAHIILWRPRITFNVRGCYTVFCFMENKIVSPNCFPFLLKLRWRMIGVVLTLLILIGFQLRIPTRVMLRWSLLLLRHLAYPRLRSMLLMSLP